MARNIFCSKSGNNPDHHFAGAGKMIETGKGCRVCLPGVREAETCGGYSRLYERDFQGVRLTTEWETAETSWRLVAAILLFRWRETYQV